MHYNGLDYLAENRGKLCRDELVRYLFREFEFGELNYVVLLGGRVQVPELFFLRANDQFLQQLIRVLHDLLQKPRYFQEHIGWRSNRRQIGAIICDIFQGSLQCCVLTVVPAKVFHQIKLLRCPEGYLQCLLIPQVLQAFLFQVLLGPLLVHQSCLTKCRWMY